MKDEATVSVGVSATASSTLVPSPEVDVGPGARPRQDFRGGRRHRVRLTVLWQGGLSPKEGHRSRGKVSPSLNLIMGACYRPILCLILMLSNFFFFWWVWMTDMERTY